MGNNTDQFDKEESLKNILHFFPQVEKDTDGREKSELLNVIEWVKSTLAQKYGVGDNATVLFDSSSQLDGSFIKFCESKNFEVSNIITDAISVLPYKDVSDDYDPFNIYGLFAIKTPDFTFLKSTLLYKNTSTESISSFIVLSADSYIKYSEIKAEYTNWLKQRDGVVVKVIAGEEFTYTPNTKWEDLFYGEKKELTASIKTYLDNFYSSKQWYKDHNILWNTTMYIHGAGGSGKSKIVDTIMSEYDVEPMTINYYTYDENVLSTLFKYTENKKKVFLFIEDLDEIIESSSMPIPVENLFQLLSSYKSDNGNVILMTGRSSLAKYSEFLVNFDVMFELTAPEYDKCIDTLFDKFLTKSAIKDFRAKCIANEFSYGQINKMYSILLKMNIKNLDKKKEEMYTDLKKVMDCLIDENNALSGKTKPKKIGLLDKKNK